MLFSDLTRIRKIMDERGFDALISFTPENVYYLSGYPQFLGSPSISLTLVLPADPSFKPAMMVGDFEYKWALKHAFTDDIRVINQWVEVEDREALEQGETVVKERPVQYDVEQAFRMLRDILSERHLLGARIGCELQTTPPELLGQLKNALPELELKDSTQLIWYLKSVKTPKEAAAVKEATRLAELGMKAVTLDSNPRGKSISQLKLEYQRAIIEAVRGDIGGGGLTGTRISCTVGGEVGRTTARAERIATDGDIIWIDCGVSIDGYVSDIGRSFCLGDPPALAQRIYEALKAGYYAGLPMIKPGVKLSGLFNVTQEAIRSAGLPTYTRGHVGHTIGIGFGEQPPFIATGEDREIEPGMILAFECPLYVRGLGGFQLEDDVIVTELGIENFSELPRTLFVV